MLLIKDVNIHEQVFLVLKCINDFYDLSVFLVFTLTQSFFEIFYEYTSHDLNYWFNDFLFFFFLIVIIVFTAATRRRLELLFRRRSLEMF